MDGLEYSDADGAAPPSEIATRAKRPVRFSLRAILGLIALTAAGLVAWQRLIYVSPTHRIPLYEQAIGTHSLRMPLPWMESEVAVRVVARNERDGSIYVEDGKGNAVENLVLRDSDSLSQASAWLDVVRIELEPGTHTFEIARLRVFDHETRTLIDHAGQGTSGYRVIADNNILICGLGEHIPPRLDVWMEVRYYDPPGAVRRLPPEPFHDLKLDEKRSLTLHHIGMGSAPYGPGPSGLTHAHFSWSGDWPSRHFDITAVSAAGEIAPANKQLRNDRKESGVMEFAMPIDKISHFELRPDGSYHAFYFADVRIPRNANLPFARAPTVDVAVDGKEFSKPLTQFEPLDVRVTVKHGKWVIGLSSLGYEPQAATEGAECFGTYFQIEGVSNRKLFGTLRPSHDILPPPVVSTANAGQSTKSMGFTPVPNSFVGSGGHPLSLEVSGWARTLRSNR